MLVSKAGAYLSVGSGPHAQN